MNASQLITPHEYQACRQTIFPTLESLRWFVRQHRSQLIVNGALVAPTGRKLVAPENFDLVVIEVGSKRALRALGASAREI